MAQSETQSRRAARVVPMVLTLLLAAAIYGVMTANAFHNGSVSFAETFYLIKSWWYVSGAVAPYTATPVERLEEAGALVLGKVNLDEFTFGSSNESSAFQPSTRHMLSARPGGNGPRRS